jgi:hypothetical protein
VVTHISLLIKKAYAERGPFFNSLCSESSGDKPGWNGDLYGYDKSQQQVNAILKYGEKVILRYAQALIEAGADILLIAEPAGSQLSLPTYEGFSLAHTKRIIASLKRPCVLHACGNAGHLVQKMCSSGAAALSLDDIDMNMVITNVPIMLWLSVILVL